MFTFSSTRFSVRFVAKRYILQQKCLNGQITKNLPARNTLLKLLALYTDPESHNAHHYRQTDRRHDDANSWSYCVAVRSAKNGHKCIQEILLDCDQSNVYSSHVVFLAIS